jgi:hypothetical protein
MCFFIGWKFGVSKNTHFLARFYRSQQLSLISVRIAENSLRL